MSRDAIFCGRVVCIWTRINLSRPDGQGCPRLVVFTNSRKRKIVVDSMPLPSGGDGGR